MDRSLLQVFLRHQLQSYPPDHCQHTFISFNYDLLLDRAVQQAARHTCRPDAALWQPSTGYGFKINWYLAEPASSSAPTVSRGAVTAGTAEHTDAHPLPLVQSGNIFVLKAHGSLNWIVRHNENHHSGREGLLADPDTPVFIPLANANSLDLDYWRAERQECANIYYKPQSSNNFPEAHASIFVVPPTPPGKKTGPVFLTQVRDTETAAIRDADDIFVVWWSMPITDQDQICMIRSCIVEREKALDSVTVINRGERPEYFDRIADTIGTPRSALRIFNNGFLDYVYDATAG